MMIGAPTDTVIGRFPRRIDRQARTRCQKGVRALWRAAGRQERRTEWAFSKGIERRSAVLKAKTTAAARNAQSETPNVDYLGTTVSRSAV